MKKIIGILKPFDKNQTLYIYEDGNKLDTIQTTVDDIAQVIFKLTEQYNINQVDFTGIKTYTQGLIKQIQKEEILKYNYNKINFNCI